MLKGEQMEGALARKSLLSFGRDQTESRPERSHDARPAFEERQHSVRERREARRQARTDTAEVQTSHEADAAAGKGAWEEFADARAGEAPFHIAGRSSDYHARPSKEEAEAERPPLWRRRSAETLSAPHVDAPAPVAASAAGETTTPPLDAPAVQGVGDMPASAIRMPDNRPELDGQLRTSTTAPLKVIGAVLDSKRLVLTTTMLGALVGVGIALSTPKKYEAVAELLADPRDFASFESAEGLPSEETLAIENQIAVLMSGTVLTQVVDKLNLTADSEFNGQKSSFNAGAFMTELRALLTPSGGGNDDIRKEALTVENLARSLTVKRGSKAFTIDIGVSTESADKSALIANTVASTFLQNRGPIQAGEQTARLDELRKGVEAAQRKVAAFKTENNIVDPEGRPITDDEIARLNEQLSTARARTLELNARATSVRDVDVDSVLGGAIPESLTSDVITELMAQYAVVRQEADKLIVRLGPRHPERQAVEAQVSSLRARISDELRRIASSVQVDVKRAVELEQQLAQRLAQLKVLHSDVGPEFVQLRELERDVATKRAAYDSALLRAKEADEQRGISTANMTVISRADPPLDPAGPSRNLIALGGMLLGFASGVGLAAMRGASDSRRGRRHDTARPVLDTHPDTAKPPVPPVAPMQADESASRERQPSTFRERPLSADRRPRNPQDFSTPGVSTEDKPMHHRYADPHPAWNAAQPGSQPSSRGWPAPQPSMPAAYAPYPSHPTQGSYAQQPMTPQPAYYPVPQPAFPYPMPVPFYGYDHGGYASFPHPHAPYGMAQAAPGYPAYPPHYPAPDMHHVPVVGYRDAPAYPERYMHVTPPASDERSQSSRAIEEIRASLAEFREAVRDLTESRQKRRFF